MAATKQDVRLMHNLPTDLDNCVRHSTKCLYDVPSPNHLHTISIPLPYHDYTMPHIVLHWNKSKECPIRAPRSYQRCDFYGLLPTAIYLRQYQYRTQLAMLLVIMVSRNDNWWWWAIFSRRPLTDIGECCIYSQHHIVTIYNVIPVGEH